MAKEASFGELVHEAFIAPLRSVLIVDDQYPTWEEIFNSKIAEDEKSSGIEECSKAKSWQRSTAVARELHYLVREFRSQDPGLIIDIHDGGSLKLEENAAENETPEQLADHLHQSDLLILDYNLEGAEGGTGGALARQILLSVLSNQHFNIVVVHTSEDLDQVFHECIIALTCQSSTHFSEDCLVSLEELKEVIQEKEDEGDFDRTKLTEKMDLPQYLECRNPEGGIKNRALGQFMQGEGAFNELKNWCDSLELNKKQQKVFFYWMLQEYEEIRKNLFCSSTPPTGLSWKDGARTKWLRTSRGFVCFVKKGPERLLQDLRASLEDWKPSPSRLISAKYRYEISRMGADVEDKTLCQNFAHAKFYDIIRNPTPHELDNDLVEGLREQRLREYVARQSEMLSFLIEDQVAEFGRRLHQCDVDVNGEFYTHYGVNLDDATHAQDARDQYNRHVCCLPSKQKFNGVDLKEQLDSGHVFKLEDSWWICATPACDLQLGQTKIAFSEGSAGSLRPFTALKLHKANLKKLSDGHINSGTYCFIESEGKIIGLGAKDSKEDVEKPASSKVTWRSMVAKNYGTITNGQLDLLEIKLDGDDVTSEANSARVYAKLRYEYALNFIQRVGGSVSRIGLGYVT